MTNWLTIEHDCHVFALPALESPEFVPAAKTFWRLFFRDVLPKNRHFEWDHLKIHLEGSDGRFTCYPHTRKQLDPDRFRDPNETLMSAWASVRLPDVHDTFFNLPEGPAFREKARQIYTGLVERLTEAVSKAVQEPPGSSFKPLTLVFHIYDDVIPFHTELVE